MGILVIGFAAAKTSSVVPSCPAVHQCCRTLLASPRLRADFVDVCPNLLKQHQPRLCAIRHHELLAHLDGMGLDVPPTCAMPIQRCVKLDLVLKATQNRRPPCNRDSLHVHLRWVSLPRRQTLGTGAMVWRQLKRCAPTIYGKQVATNSPFTLDIDTQQQGAKYVVRLVPHDVTETRLVSGKPYWDGSVLAQLLPEIKLSRQGFKGHLANFSFMKTLKAKTRLSLGFKTAEKNDTWFTGRLQLTLIGTGVWYEPHDKTAKAEFNACRLN